MHQETVCASAPALSPSDYQPAPLIPFDGWPLEICADLDRGAPGFLSHMLHSPKGWRQSIFFLLALHTGQIEDPQLRVLRARLSDSADLAARGELVGWLRNSSMKVLLRQAITDVPNGLAGALNKLGFQPLPTPGHYRQLLALLRQRGAQGKKRSRVLMQLPELRAQHIAVLLQLDPVALHPEAVKRMSPQCAERLNDVLAGLRHLSSAGTDEALAQSVEAAARLQGPRFLGRLTDRWLPRLDVPAAEVPGLSGHPDFERVLPSNAARIASEFRNCLRRLKMGDLASGVWSAWVWRPGDLICTVRLMEEGAVLTGVFGKGNMCASPSSDAALRDELRKAGIFCFTPKQPPEVVRGLVSHTRLRVFEEMEFG